MVKKKEVKERKKGISIIVPVYNVEKYLKKCIDSLLNQQFDNYEILLIDDGSTDQSSLICDEYAKNNPDRIIVFHKKNGGLSSARNYGIEKANFTYLMFVDSDDWIEENCLEMLYKEIEQGYDAVCFDAYMVPDGLEYGEYRSTYDGETEEITEYIKNSTEPAFSASRIYRYELWEKTKFPEPNIWYEDIATIPIILSHCQKVHHLKKAIYYYRQRQGAITSIEKDDRNLDVIKAWERSFKEANSMYKKEIVYAIYYCIYTFIKFRPAYAEEYLNWFQKNKKHFEKNSYIEEKINQGALYSLFDMELIPKKIHYFWFGGNPLNELAKECIASWKKYAPDYEIIEWNETNCNLDDCPYVREAYDNKKWAFVADYFRVKVLEEQGGFYMDTDMELRSSIDFLRLNKIFFPFETNNVNSCIFGSIPHHQVMKDMLDSYHKSHFVLEDGSLDMSTTIVVRLTKILEKQYSLDYSCVTNYLPDRFTIYSSDVLIIDVFNGENVAIHHYDASWWDVKIGKMSYMYNVLEYYFTTTARKRKNQNRKVKNAIYNIGRKALRIILPKNAYQKLKKTYHKIRHH